MNIDKILTVRNEVAKVFQKTLHSGPIYILRSEIYHHKLQVKVYAIQQ